METYYYNRGSRAVERELVLGDSMLKLAYSNTVGRLAFWPLFRTSLFSRLMGLYADSAISKKRIERTIADLHINMADFIVPEGGFRCFNDFFCRKLQPNARPFAENGFCSPADSRLSIIPELQNDTVVPLKGRSFTVGELLGDPGKSYASAFEGGSLAIFRLCPADYHRYHYPDDGVTLDHWRMKGNYHSVNPLALMQGIRIFTHNVREISILKLNHFGLAAYIEVGAFGVASIRQTHAGSSFKRGDEKGYFTFGASTVMVLFEKNAIKFDDDLLEHQPLESFVHAGEAISHG